MHPMSETRIRVPSFQSARGITLAKAALCFAVLSRGRGRPARLKLAVVVASALITSACVYPVVDVSPEKLMAPNPRPINDIPSANDLVGSLTSTLKTALHDRQVAHFVLQEVIFYGSLVALYGIAAKEIGARNTGGGLAGIGAALDSHYSLTTQITAINNAYSRSKCLKEALDGVDLKTLALFDDNPSQLGDLGTPALNDALKKIPQQTVGAVNDISAQLVRDLNAATLTTTSLNDVADIAKKFSEDLAKTSTVAPKPSEKTEMALDEGESEHYVIYNRNVGGWP